jgi:hypothetical protein
MVLLLSVVMDSEFDGHRRSVTKIIALRSPVYARVSILLSNCACYASHALPDLGTEKASPPQAPGTASDRKAWAHEDHADFGHIGYITYDVQTA